MIDLRMLGTTELRREGRALDSFLTGPKRLGVLAYLVLARPRGYHRRDTLLPLFWPERGQTSARNALSNMLYHIRRELGEEMIVNRGAEEIGVQRNRLACDVIAFEKALDRDDPEAALDLYQGDLLQGFHVPDAAPTFDQWLARERERLRRRAAEGAWACAEAAEHAGNGPAARSWAKKAAGFTPFSDDAHRRLITLLQRMGDRTGAQKAYEDFAARLRAEWDMEPTDELTALVECMGDESSEAALPRAERVPSTADRQEIAPPEAPHKEDLHPPTESHSLATSAPDERTPPATRLTNTARWTRWAGAVTLVILGVAGWMLWSSTSAPDKSASAVAEPSVAVLPFTNLSAEDSTDYFSLGITDELLTRLAQMRQAAALDPRSWHAHHNLGYALYCNRQYEAAIRALETALELGSRLWSTERHLLHTLLKQSQQRLRQGRSEAVGAPLERMRVMYPDKDPQRLNDLEDAVRGRKEKVLQRLDQVERPEPEKLTLLLLVGEAEHSLDLIEQKMSFDSRVYADPLFDPVRHHPRFEQLVARRLGRDVALR